MAEFEFQPLISEEQDSSVSWYKAGAAGIASGILKVPEGIFSLAAELIDLGLDTDTAADVEQFFDKLNPFEEVAEQHGAGKLTEALVSIGVPGAYGFKIGSKLANSYFASKKAGKVFSAANGVKSAMKADALNKKAGYAKFAAGVAGGAAGETFVADVEEIGSFGDLFDRGPTQLDTWGLDGGREDATRKLMNRFKFGSEALLITPFAAGVGKSAKKLATEGKKLAHSNSKFDRYLAKFAAGFTPEGELTKEIFGSQRVMEGFRAGDINKATDLVRDLDVTISKAFPQMQKVLDRSLTTKEQDQFYKDINELIFDGDLTKLSDPKKTDAFVKNLTKKNVDKETASNLVNIIDDARGTFGNLLETTNRFNAPELRNIIQDRLKQSIQGTYKIFETNPVLGIFGRFRPTNEAMENAIEYFRSAFAKQNPDKTYNKDSIQYYQDAKELVDRIVEQGLKAKKTSKGLPDINYLKKTLEDTPGGDTIIKSLEETGAPTKVIKDLLGYVQDPRYGIFNAITELSGMARTASMLDQIANENKAMKELGEPGAFWDNLAEARKATNGVIADKDLVKVGDVLGDLTKFNVGSLANPLSTKYTTRDIANAWARANNLVEGAFTAAVRGREGASAAEKGASFLWRSLVLLPKAGSQLAKTVFSIPTHLRNLISAGAFASANGILFEGLWNPKLLGNSFKRGWEISGVAPWKGSRFNNKEFEKAYRELLELGIVNSQVQIGDLKNLMRDVKWGEGVMDLDKIMNPMLTKLKKIPAYLQGKYVAEDDFWKITNYFVELDRRAAAYKRNGINKTVQELKEETASIVRNTVPNYSYVGDYVRTARLLPVGNFMSFPSEMIRTTTNIAEQAVKEMRHSKPVRGSNISPWVYETGKGFVKNDNPMYRIGATRAAGMATTLTVVPTMTVEGAKALYNVTEDEIQALRQFVPSWSKNSTLIPIRDEETGDLKYIDFSHSNAYDLIARPFRTLANEITMGQNDGETILKSFTDGMDEVMTELASPFIDESIWTTAASDVSLYPFLPGRGGRTREGKVLWTDQTPIGERYAIKFRHLMEALAPSYKQGVRLYQTATGTPTKTGEFLEGKTLGINDQVLGFMGFRPISVDPLKAMGFKIAEYQRGIREARREFTGGYFGLLKGGPIDANDVITKFYESNKARFNVQMEMYKNINSAQILGESKSILRKEFNDRQLTDKTFNSLAKGKFEPYYPSDDIRDRFKEIAKDLGTYDVFNTVRPTLRRMLQDMKRLNYESGWDLDLVEYSSDLDTPPLPIQPAPSAQIINSALTQNNNVMKTGLTQTENALLNDEEKMIRLRNRNIA